MLALITQMFSSGFHMLIGQLTSTTGHMSHVVTSHAQRQMKLTAISTNQAWQCSILAVNFWSVTYFGVFNFNFTYRKKKNQ
jgi:hypothetical protein